MAEWTAPTGVLGGEWEMWSPHKPLGEGKTHFRTLQLRDDRMAQYRYDESNTLVHEPVDTQAAFEMLVAEEAALSDVDWEIVPPASPDDDWRASTPDWEWAGKPLGGKEGGVYIMLSRGPDPQEEGVAVSDLISAIHGWHLLRAAMLRGA